MSNDSSDAIYAADPTESESVSAADPGRFWPSVADIMAASALVILLFMFLSFIQSFEVAQRTDEIEQIYKQMDDALKIKASIVTALQQAMSKSLGKENVSVDDKDLTIRIREDIFFDRGKSDIKANARPILINMADAFTAILDDEKLRSYISAILIEGHCDDTGTPEVNWRLSTERAVKVVEYLHHASPRLAKRYPRYFGAAGYGEFRPTEDGERREGETGRRPAPSRNEANLAKLSPDYGAKDRRIEIRVILRDDRIKEQLDIYMQRYAGMNLE